MSLLCRHAAAWWLGKLASSWRAALYNSFVTISLKKAKPASALSFARDKLFFVGFRGLLVGFVSRIMCVREPEYDTAEYSLTSDGLVLVLNSNQIH
jgi:hypothetical protein